jgi:hypothetical protein
MSLPTRRAGTPDVPVGLGAERVGAGGPLDRGDPTGAEGDGLVEGGVPEGASVAGNGLGHLATG